MPFSFIAHSYYYIFLNILYLLLCSWLCAAFNNIFTINYYVIHNRSCRGFIIIIVYQIYDNILLFFLKSVLNVSFPTFWESADSKILIQNPTFQLEQKCVGDVLQSVKKIFEIKLLIFNQINLGSYIKHYSNLPNFNRTEFYLPSCDNITMILE